MGKEELLHKIETLVKEYFEDNDKSVKEMYSLKDDESEIVIDITFVKY